MQGGAQQPVEEFGGFNLWSARQRSNLDAPIPLRGMGPLFHGHARWPERTASTNGALIDLTMSLNSTSASPSASDGSGGIVFVGHMAHPERSLARQSRRARPDASTAAAQETHRAWTGRERPPDIRSFPSVQQRGGAEPGPAPARRTRSPGTLQRTGERERGARSLLQTSRHRSRHETVRGSRSPPAVTGPVLLRSVAQEGQEMPAQVPRGPRSRRIGAPRIVAGRARGHRSERREHRQRSRSALSPDGSPALRLRLPEPSGSPVGPSQSPSLESPLVFPDSSSPVAIPPLTLIQPLLGPVPQRQEPATMIGASGFNHAGMAADYARHRRTSPIRVRTQH